MPLKNPILTAIETIIKSVPRAAAANTAVKQAKEIEGLINDILKKPKLTVQDSAELQRLKAIAEKALKDGNPSMAPGSNGRSVSDAIASKVASGEKRIADAQAAAKRIEEAKKATEEAKRIAADAAAKAKKTKEAADKAEAAKKAEATRKAEEAAKKAADAKKRAEALAKAEKAATKEADAVPPKVVPAGATKTKVTGAVKTKVTGVKTKVTGVAKTVVPTVIKATAGVAAGADSAADLTPTETPTETPSDATGNPNQNKDRNYDDQYGAFTNEDGGGDTGGGAGGAGGAGGGGGDTDEVFGEEVTLEEVPGDGEDNAPARYNPDGSGNPFTPVENTGADFEKTWLILRAKLLAAGLPVATVDKSVDFFRTIITDGKFKGDNEISDVVDQYLYAKTYKSNSGTEISSPFYEKFGKFNDKLSIQKKPDELVKLVLGYERLVDKYSVSSKFKSDDSISKYMENDTSVAELDERMNSARLRALEADKAYTQTLRALSYISEDSQLTDFFLDPEIGTMELENRRKTAAFATEAVRRAGSGIKLDTASAQELSARFTALGYSEAQIANLSGEKYANIADQLQPTTALSGIYEKAGAADATIIQKELESEQFLGMASARRKKLAEQNIKAFSGSSGISRYGLSTGSVGSII